MEFAEYQWAYAETRGLSEEERPSDNPAASSLMNNVVNFFDSSATMWSTATPQVYETITRVSDNIAATQQGLYYTGLLLSAFTLLSTQITPLMQTFTSHGKGDTDEGTSSSTVEPTSNLATTDTLEVTLDVSSVAEITVPGSSVKFALPEKVTEEIEEVTDEEEDANNASFLSHVTDKSFNMGEVYSAPPTPATGLLFRQNPIRNVEFQTDYVSDVEERSFNMGEVYSAPPTPATGLQYRSNPIRALEYNHTPHQVMEYYVEDRSFNMGEVYSAPPTPANGLLFQSNPIHSPEAVADIGSDEEGERSFFNMGEVYSAPPTPASAFGYQANPIKKVPILKTTTNIVKSLVGEFDTEGAEEEAVFEEVAL